MGLEHKFAILSKDSDEWIVSSDMDSIIISDTIIIYIGDSLNWIHTRWNGKNVQEGISYYGFSIIEGDEIEKLKNIMKQWKALFWYAPEGFYLTGDFMPDNDRYEKNWVNRNELIETLEGCINICEKALSEGNKILHNGI